MSPLSPSRLSDERPHTAGAAVTAGLCVLALYDLALAAFMALAPHAFYRAIGPFGSYNEHYIRDTATFSAALGIGCLLALRRPAWRVPLLAVTSLQFALHTVNHLLDIADAHPAWTGYFDFVSLLAATVLLVWLLALARGEDARRRRAGSTRSTTPPLPLTPKEAPMSRIEPPRRGPVVRVAHALARREVKRMTGKAVLTPDVEARSHRIGLLMGYAAFEKSVARGHRVPEHLRALVVLKSAVMLGCEMCQDLGAFEARANGVSDVQQRDLHRYRDSEHFDETERFVLDFAVGMTVTPVQVSDELYAALRERFDEGQLVELANLIAVENLRSRFNAAFGLGSVGFSEGAVCARMEPALAAAGTSSDPGARPGAQEAAQPSARTKAPAPSELAAAS